MSARAHKHADPGRAVELVAREGVEIAAERRDIDRQPRDRLAPVDQELGADRVREIGGALHVEHRAEHVRNVRQCDQFMLRGQHALGGVEIDATVFGERADVDDEAGALADQLPRHDVAVMLERREQDAVAGLEVGQPPALRDEIDRLGRAAHEDDLALGRGANEARHPPPRRFVGERHVGRALVHPAVHGGVGLAVGGGDRVEHGARLLRRRGGVEIGPAGRDRGKVGYQIERPIGDEHTHCPLPMGEREGTRREAVGRVRACDASGRRSPPHPDPLPHGERGLRCVRYHATPRSQASAVSANASRTASSPIRAKASATNARVSIARAGSGAMPRLAR